MLVCRRLDALGLDGHVFGPYMLSILSDADAGAFTPLLRVVILWNLSACVLMDQMP